MPVDSVPPSQRFCLFHQAQGETLRGCVVYIHPFAEEMNKSRRMAALQARALAAAGFAVLQIDLHGCGDSSGDFGDATWQDWVDDAVRACTWLHERDGEHAHAPLWLWGLRAGCLVAAEAATRIDKPCNFCFWQPASAGNLVLQQFLRLRLAGNLLTGNSKGLMHQMRQQLGQGQAIEIAGYLLGPKLAVGLQAAQLRPPASAANRRVQWFELSTNPDSDLSPASSTCIEKWEAAGYSVSTCIAYGPAFWQTAEIEDAAELIERTAAALTEFPGARLR